MTYHFLYATHVSCVVLTFSLFLLRGVWMLQGSAWLEHRVVRILPHVIDSVLLASAIALAMLLQQYPGAHGWLTAKVAALVVYILLGTVALRRGRTKAVRSVAFVLAVTTFGYIVSVAIYHHPAGIFWRLVA